MPTDDFCSHMRNPDVREADHHLSGPAGAGGVGPSVGGAISASGWERPVVATCCVGRARSDACGHGGNPRDGDEGPMNRGLRTPAALGAGRPAGRPVLPAVGVVAVADGIEDAAVAARAGEVIMPATARPTMS